MPSTFRVGHIGLSFHNAGAREVERIFAAHGHPIKRSATPREEMFRRMDLRHPPCQPLPAMTDLGATKMNASQDPAMLDAVADGLMVFPSPYGVTETAERMGSAVIDLGMTVVARIDHAAAATHVGLHLRPTLVLVFGIPVAGTPLMEACPTVAIDLPLKALIWRSDDKRTWLACNDPAWIVERHAVSIGDGRIAEILKGMRASLVSAAMQATGVSSSP